MEQSYYTKKILERFLHPRNLGKIKDADGVGDTQNLRCGDLMKLYIKVEKKDGKEIIKDAKFETIGCGHAISISDMICDLVKGKTIDEAIKMTNKDVIDSLDGLPPIKIHCSLLSVDALSEAIYDYLFKEKKEIPKEVVSRHQRLIVHSS